MPAGGGVPGAGVGAGDTPRRSRSARSTMAMMSSIAVGGAGVAAAGEGAGGGAAAAGEGPLSTGAEATGWGGGAIGVGTGQGRRASNYDKWDRFIEVDVRPPRYSHLVIFLHTKFVIGDLQLDVNVIIFWEIRCLLLKKIPSCIKTNYSGEFRCDDFNAMMTQNYAKRVRSPDRKDKRDPPSLCLEDRRGHRLRTSD